MNLPITEIRKNSPDGFQSASPKQVENIVQALCARMQLADESKPSDLYTIIATQGERLNYAEQNIANNGMQGIEELFKQVGFDSAKKICIGWSTGDEIDIVDQDQFKTIFGRAWSPLLDDVIIFDPEASWCISINENGGIRYIDRGNLELPAIDRAEESIQSVQVKGMQVSNLSGLPLNQVLNWLPSNLNAEQVVFFPDACPSKAPLPTGVAIATRDPNWRRLAISDVGCGMQLLESGIELRQFIKMREQWDALGKVIGARYNELGDLGGGNHFLDAIASYEDQKVYFLIHTGSRLESGLLDEFVDNPIEFDKKYKELVEWAFKNRSQIAKDVQKYFGELKLVVDLPHNTIEQKEDGLTIIRKGTVAVEEGDINIIPSSLTGDVSLVRATKTVNQMLNSLSHGTGRAMTRSQAKTIDVDVDAIRRAVMIPDYIEDASFRTEGPHSYRPLDRALELLDTSIEQIDRFLVVGYLGHLPKN